MASQLERPPNGSEDNSPRLPNITEGRNLVSPLQKPKSTSLKDQAKIWAVDVIQRYTDIIMNVFVIFWIVIDVTMWLGLWNTCIQNSPTSMLIS